MTVFFTFGNGSPKLRDQKRLKSTTDTTMYHVHYSSGSIKRAGLYIRSSALCNDVTEYFS